MTLGLAALLGQTAAADDMVCRTNALGATICSGVVRPEPKRQIRSDVQALDRVQPRPDAGEPETQFVPSYRRGTLSTTTIETDRPIDLCRPDTLGNLNCR